MKENANPAYSVAAVSSGNPKNKPNKKRNFEIAAARLSTSHQISKPTKLVLDQLVQTINHILCPSK